MTDSQRFFLCMIKDYIHEAKTVPFQTNEWDEIFSYARSHQLTAVIFNQCKGFVPPDTAESYEPVYWHTVFLNVQRKTITNDTIKLLEDEGIHCFLIKGFDIAEYYPNWQYRTMGDTDIVVDDLEKAHAVMTANGFHVFSHSQNREYQYWKQDMEFELHDRLVYEEAINLDSAEKFLNRFEEYVSNRKLDDSFHFIFVLNHLRKHFMNRGVGFRQFVDLALLIKNDTKINWAWTEEKLRQTGLLTFARITFYYIERWFGVAAPLGAEPVAQDVFEESTQFVFANGVFGYDNTENEDYLLANTVRHAKYPKLAMAKTAIGKAFPPYWCMAASPYYAFLRGRPFLLPVGWLYRFFRAFKKRDVKDGKNQITHLFVSNEYLAKRASQFRNWGLE